MTGYFGPGQFGSSPFDEFLARFFGAGEPRQPVQRVDITRLMSDQARELVETAATRTAELGRADLDDEQLLWAATQTEPTRQLLTRAGADPEALAGRISERAGHGEHQGPPTLTPVAKRALLEAHQISRAMGTTYIGPDHVLLALAANQESPAGRLLAGERVTPQVLQRAMGVSRGTSAGPGPERASTTPTLDEYGQDMTQLASEGKLDPVIGREDEIEQTVEVLSRRTKNNPVLIGEAGVGKTAVVEGIAQRIVDHDVPDTLADKRVVQLDLSALVAGTRYRGDFEERMRKVIDEVRKHRDELILFIDEMHTVVGAGSSTEGGMDAGNMLKPSLARGELHVIGATTLDEFRKNIEKDAALARRFQSVFVAEPSVPDTIAILRGLRDRYEAHHQVRFTDEAVVAAAELSDRYLTDRFLPDKAIDLIDQAGARVRLRTRAPAADILGLEEELEQLCRDKDQAVADEQYERASQLRDRAAQLRERLERARRGHDDHGEVLEVTAEDIAEVVSRATGIPVRQLTEEEKNRLLRLEEHLHQRVIGQDEAVSAIAEAVRRARSGLGDPNRPVGSFLFLGPTGVGKTELARALAEALFGDETHMVRLDMSEFQERHTVSRLVGAPPGYVGYGEAGELTEAVRRRPYSVLLLDEMEKAHPDVFNTLLQVLDDGRLTDGQGRTVDFKNTVLIMTSNLGSELITGGGTLGFSPSRESAETKPLRDKIMPKLREAFRPEFLNRIDEIIVFRKLSEQQLRQITELLLERSRRRLHNQGITLEFTPAAVDWIARNGYQPEFGARPLRRVIQREVDNHLAQLLMRDQLLPGQHVRVDVAENRLTFDVRARVDA
ncbi:ATP-dependent Clp protease ATP-binding subunit [Goodfellowiella coeruleoviolacea]|uniref:ATP-dependent Clp protease ATP-binding subunit ClpC n=1 Tax=Goodfellowiella coeruleoviolacea TaxID=334858 RepID=A0AAE3GDZ7_9PSEU|nr:ATP-dependent Clp protease ATP-binding subunit [Goodfellowiella coeruleoviolacea]MCP2166471.1 ATP-dependent Clp protease ATP-binding subunit ClpC [Goodfellowiella coeruleoviolacea]